MTDNFDKATSDLQARDYAITASDPTAAPVKVKPGWTGWVTMIAAGAAVLLAGVAAFHAWSFSKTNQLAISGGIKPAYQAVCLAYSDFVLAQAHNGYTPEQIQHVIDFAGSHKLMPDEEPERFSMPNRWPTISDEKACGTPAQVIDQANR
jgi:hypothetical protein